jgi:hypothetical protein
MHRYCRRCYKALFFRRISLLVRIFLTAVVFSFSLVVAPFSAFAQYEVSHLAGGPGGSGYLDGIGLRARFSGPTGIWGDSQNLYIADSGERTIRQLVRATGEVRTIGRLDSTLSCTGLPFNGHVLTIVVRDLSVWADVSNVYIGDACLHVLYKLDLSSGVVTLLSGKPQQLGQADGSATDARFTVPNVVAGDDSYLYVVDQGVVHRIDKQSGESVRILSDLPGIIDGDGTYFYATTSVDGVTISLQAIRTATGEIKTIATYPFAFGGRQIVRHTEAAGDFLYMISSDNTIKRIAFSTGEMTTFAGGIGTTQGAIGGWKDGPGSSAEFSRLFDLWADSDYLFAIENSNNTIRQIRFATAEVKTIAGLPAISGNADGPATNARFWSPQSVWGDGNYLYITDSMGAIRRVRVSDGDTSTLAGISVYPVFQSPSTDGIGATARFNAPSGVWGDGTNLYVVDRRAYAIRKIVIATAEVTTLAGTLGVSGFVDGTRNEARFKLPGALWGDGASLYVIDNSAIRKVDVATGAVSTIAGMSGTFGEVDGIGSSARFEDPTGIWGDGANLYVTDSSGGTVRKIALLSGLVTTLAGALTPRPFENDNIDGIGSAARFRSPGGIWGDGVYLYVTDLQLATVRRIRIANGETDTIAGTADKNGSDDTLGLASRFAFPMGIWGDGFDLYVVDSLNYAIRKIASASSASAPVLTSVTPTQALPGMTVTFTLTGFNFVPGETGIVVNGPGTQVVGLDVKTATSLDVAIQIAADATIGARTVRVVQSGGTSNPVAFDIGPIVDLTKASFSIASRGGFSVTTAEEPGAATVGYARILGESGNPAPAGLAIYGNRSGGVLVSEASVPSNSPIQNGRINFDSINTTNTGIAILNPNDVPVRFSYTMLQPDGSQFYENSFDLAPGQQLSRFVDEVPIFGAGGGGGGANIEGTLTFTASSPVSVIALRGLVNERSEFLMSTLPVTNLDARRDQTVVFPHAVDGAGWSSRIILINPGDQTLTGRLQFISRAGQPMTVVLNGVSGSEFDFSIPGKGSRTFLSGNTSADVRVGWIRIVPAGAAYPDGVLIFSNKPAGAVASEAAVAASVPSSAFRLYVEKDNGTRTGFAVANPNATAAQLTYELTDINGIPVGSAAMLQIGPNGQVAMFIDELPGFENLPSNFRGVLRLSTNGGGVSVLGLRGRYNEREEFLISNAQPVDDKAPLNPSELFFTHFVQSGDFTTQFVLLPGGSSASGGTLEFFSQTGQRLDLPLK